MKPLVIARPEPGNSETAARAHLLGLDVVASPLFDVIEIEWNLDNSISYDGIFITSANGLRYAGPQLSALYALPLFAVGSASEAAARALGFSNIFTGTGDGAALAELAAAQGARSLLHLAGEPFKPVHHPALSFTVAQVYRTVETAPDLALLDALARPCVLLAHSPRMARRLAELASSKAETDVVAISAQAADAAGSGWKSISWPEKLDAAAMLDIAAPLCRAA